MVEDGKVDVDVTDVVVGGDDENMCEIGRWGDGTMTSSSSSSLSSLVISTLTR